MELHSSSSYHKVTDKRRSYIYKADPQMNSTCDCYPEPQNAHSTHAIAMR